MTVVVALWTAGGPDIGAGHLSRCRSLALALRDAGACVHLAADASPLTLALFDWHGLPVHTVSEGDAATPATWGIFGPTDTARVVISDRPDVQPGHLAAWRALGVGTIAHLCDDGAERLAADLFINGDAAPPMLQPRAAASHCGPQWHIVRPEAVRRRETPWQRNGITRVLLSLGAADPGECTTEIMAGLTHGDALPFEVTVVTRNDAVRRLALPPRVRVIPHTPDLPSLMVAHDVVVTLPGLTAYEAACIGRPVALVEWSRLAPYAQAMSRAGLAHLLGDAQRAAMALRALPAHREALRRCAALASAAIDGQGASRVATLVLTHAAQASTHVTSRRQPL